LGRRAFGGEGGSWTLAGNAATFAEVVNASTNAQAIAFPMAYAGDFKPETLGTLTFTNLTVGGTFQPVGVGEVEFSGETALETADVRYNVRTWDNPARYPLTSTGWAASKGYGTNQKKQIHLLRTLPGGHTEIGYLQTTLTGQRLHATILDGDFTVRRNIHHCHSLFRHADQEYNESDDKFRNYHRQRRIRYNRRLAQR
jgi:hypothetical protein